MSPHDSPHDQTSPRQPLDADERALAERLARLGPHGEPSPSLDSKILSAAHAAVGNASRSGTRRAALGKRSSGNGTDARNSGQPGRRPRWPLGLGIAASVVLAVGLAWQMRPLPNATPAYRSEADSALAGAAVETKQAAESVARMVAVPQPAPVVAPPIAAKPMENRKTEDAAMAVDEAATANRGQGAPATPDQMRERAQAQQTETMEQEAGPQQARSSPSPPPAPPAPPGPVLQPVFTAPLPPPIVFDAPAPIEPAHPPGDTAVTTAPRGTGESQSARNADKRAASQAAGQAAEQAKASAQAAASKANADTRKQARASAPTAQPQAFGTLSAADAAGSDMPTEDVPPATVASPLVRDAWLARIRTLATQGRTEEARTSLRAFVLRYPRYLLPTDLRALQETSPGSTPADGPAADGDTPDR